MWKKRRFNNDFAGPSLSGYGPEWTYLGGPGAATKEQAFRFGERGERADFERWARSYADGKFFNILDAEYQKGTAYALAEAEA